MNKLANARSHPAFRGKNRPRGRLARNHPLFFFFLGKVYFFKSQNDYFLREGQCIHPQSLAPLQNFMEAPRNIPRCHFVYTGAAPYRAAQARFRKNPAVAAAGPDTQFFRPLVQEEEVSSRGSLPVQRLRVNSILPRQLVSADSILSKGI